MAMRVFTLVCFICSLLLCPLTTTLHAARVPGSQRFFVEGSGVLHLKNYRNGRTATVSLLTPSGALNEKAFATVDWVFDYPTQAKGEHISPRLLFMVSYFGDLLAPGKTINIESAYRSPDYNDKIRKMGNNAARTSTHIDGIALDFWLQGVSGMKIWETIKSKNCGGIGNYGGKMVHFDAGKPRFWQAATSGTRSPLPDENRHLYLSTVFDRYAAGETLRMALSSLSSFDFGVEPAVTLVRAGNTTQPVAQIPLAEPAGPNGCRMISDRKTSRFLRTTLPANLPPGRYQLQLTFCNRPFEHMPETTLSNPIEVVR